MLPDFQFIQSVSNGFLSEIQVTTHQGTALAQGRFDQKQFSADLYTRLGIPFPDRLERAVAKRQADYLAGRVMARYALHALGRSETHIPTAQNRAPIWPQGIRGAITHTSGRSACLLSKNASDFPGIDIEKIAEGNAISAIEKVALSRPELSILKGMNLPENVPQTLAFSAKETIFKSLFPLVNSTFGFQAARLHSASKNRDLVFVLTDQLAPGLAAGQQLVVRFSYDSSHVETQMIYRI
ncbi:MAG: 4'-phosphopantetheinyl transferase superfamily protein [Pelagimonas sp.]|jgi:enterobactin synthetase component D|nr:4'-phosphopantetheinyl transferase superfamily protein [Pelagimonas sp.]